LHEAIIRRHEVEEKIQKGEMLADPALSPFVCNVEFSFQHRSKYDDNYEVEDLLEQEFPQGVGDSESGEGHFYINRDFKEAVKVFLQPKAKCIEISKVPSLIITDDKGVQEYLARAAVLNYSI